MSDRLCYGWSEIRDGISEIDSVIFGRQVADVSYGRYPDGTDNWPSHSITSLVNANDFYE